jgi:uncharacterized protein with PIN domain
MKLFIQFEPQFDFFLTHDPQGGRVEYALNRPASVKDIIESLGVPHTEVGAMTFDHESIDFSYVPSSSGVLKVNGIQPPFSVLSPSMLRPVPLTGIKFVADVNVIRLGRLLILLGFDVSYSSAWSDQKIADLAETQGRIVLTRDTGLLKRKIIVFARRIKADLPYDQLRETIDFFGLEKSISFFSRCTRCNIKLVTIPKNQVLHLLEPKTKQYFNRFFQCPGCKNVFWKGSHYDNIRQKISALGISIQ